MKFTTPEIAWHNRDPVCSLDIQPACFDDANTQDVWYRLATSGNDSQVVIWRVFQRRNHGGGTRIEVLSQLTRHETAVDCVRFVPTGEDILASADANGIIILWKKGEVDKFTADLIEGPKKSKEPDVVEIDGDQIPVVPTGFEEEVVNIENWNQFKVLRGHLDDVVDLSWSKDGKFLVSGSVDNQAIVWNISTGNKQYMLTTHKSWVQGVSWDPLNQFVTTISSDRSLRIFGLNGQAIYKKPSFRIFKGHVKTDLQDNHKTRLFYDYTLQSCNRRLSYSPHGELLLVPSGVIEFVKKVPAKEENVLKKDGEPMEVDEVKDVMAEGAPSSEPTELNGEKEEVMEEGDIEVIKEIKNAKKVEETTEVEYTNVCHIFIRSNLQKPLCYIPTMEKSCHAVRFCPRRFQLMEGVDNPFPFPYRMVFALVTQSEVFLYDTQQMVPFAFIKDIHYTRISDIAWSHDGRLLMISSTDGFCTFVTFGPEELGLEYAGEPYDFPVLSSKEGSPKADDVKNVVESGSATKASPKVSKKKKPNKAGDKTPTTPSTPPTTITPTVKRTPTPALGKFFTKVSKEERVQKIQEELAKIDVTPKSSKRKEPEVIEVAFVEKKIKTSPKKLTLNSPTKENDLVKPVKSQCPMVNGHSSPKMVPQTSKIAAGGDITILKSSPVSSLPVIQGTSEKKGRRVNLITLTGKGPKET